MKYLFFLSILFSSLFFSSCGADPKDAPEYQDSVTTVEKDKNTEKIFANISTENLAKYFSSYFHISGNLPCMYFDKEKDEFVMSGKQVFQKISIDRKKFAMDAYHEFLRIRGYKPDGDSSKEELTKITKDGKEYVVMQMSDLLPEMTPEEKALFNYEQLNSLGQTAPSSGYHYIANERDCPLIYASSSGLTLYAKNLDTVYKMENAKEAMKVYENYIDSIRKK
jgi:hypothetical protein